MVEEKKVFRKETIFPLNIISVSLLGGLRKRKNLSRFKMSTGRGYEKLFVVIVYADFIWMFIDS